MTEHTAQADPRTTKQLTVEFAGICCLALDDQQKRAAVLLPDVPAAMKRLGKGDEGSRHTATLVVPGTAPQTCEASYTFSVPGSGVEYSAWDLSKYSVVRFSDQGIGLTADDASICTLVDLAKVTSSNAAQLVSEPPLTTWIDIRGGKLCALKEQSTFGFAQPGTTPSSYAAYAVRFALTIPFKHYLTIELQRKDGKQDSLSFMKSTTVRIGNQCQETGSRKNHFEAYYALIGYGERPVPMPTPDLDDGQGGGTTLIEPWFCIPTFILVSLAVAQMLN